MERNDAIALRILSTGITVLVLLATWGAHGAVWLNFVLGTACGLSISVLVIVWQKQLHWIDHKIYPAPPALNLSDEKPER